MLGGLITFCSMKGTQVATCAGAGAGVVTRLQSVRCLASGFNFSQPTKRDRPPRRDRSSQPPAYAEQWQPRPRDNWQQQQRYRQDQEPWQQPRQQPRERTQPSTLTRFEHQYLVTCHPGLEKVGRCRT